MHAAQDTDYEAAAKAAAEAAAAEAAAAEHNSPPASPAKHVSLSHDPAYVFDPQVPENIRLLDPGILACMHLLCMLV